MSLNSGTRLGHYEVLEMIGAGGMGEVYRAHDSRLGRDVAIKISAAQFSERFDRESTRRSRPEPSVGVATARNSSSLPRMGR
jgi:eukaryotic-like serine/threonine-protein kinase